MLPSFVSSRSRNARTDRPCAACGRLQSWQHLPTDKVLQRGAKAAAEANASRGVMAFGNLMMLILTVFAVLMAATALQQESVLQKQEQQVQQMR